MNKIFVTPKPGLRVRREDGQVLGAAGELVERTSYWLRRERDGDVFQKTDDRGQKTVQLPAASPPQELQPSVGTGKGINRKTSPGSL